MYAIVDIAGQQFKVEKNQKIYVHRLESDEGSNLSFDKVLLLDNNGKVDVGDPVIKGASVSAKILAHVKGDKVKVFKKKRRKGYSVLNGHRQLFTEILIEDILEKGAASKKAKTTGKKKEDTEKEVKKTEPKKAEEKVQKKKTGEKESQAEKKEVVKEAKTTQQKVDTTKEKSTKEKTDHPQTEAKADEKTKTKGDNAEKKDENAENQENKED